MTQEPFIATAPYIPAMEQGTNLNGTGRSGKSTPKCSKLFASWNSRSISASKLASRGLFLLISLTIAQTIFPISSTVAMTSPTDSGFSIIAEVNGQVTICHPPPCFIAKLQANASGPDAADLTGMLLIYLAAPFPPQPCAANVTGSVVLSMNGAPTATLVGTLGPADPATAACVGGLQGVSVTLFVDSMFGIIRLTTVSPAGSTEPIGSGTGTLVITQMGQST